MFSHHPHSLPLPQHQLPGPPRPAPDGVSYSYHASAPGFQDLFSNSSMKPLVYLCKVLPCFPIGQRAQAPPHIPRGPTPHTSAPAPASWDPCFIPAPLPHSLSDAKSHRRPPQKKNSDTLSLLKGSPPPNSKSPHPAATLRRRAFPALAHADL